MTKSEAVQKAYQWAFSVQADKKSLTMPLLCAKAVLRTMEQADTAEEAYEPILGLVRGWIAERREGYAGPVKILSRYLKVDAAETVEAS